MEKIVVKLVLLALLVSTCSAALNQQEQSKKKQTQSSDRIGSSAVFPIRGNVYPTGYYYAVLHVGNPPKPYFFDIDTGSDLTWLQCDAPCVSCFKVPHPLYRPIKNSLVSCTDPVCVSLHPPDKHKCENPNDQCDYEINYADQASSMGVLVRDVFPLRFTNGSLLGPRLSFGCGYDQQVTDPNPSPIDGTLGLGRGKPSIVSQLHNLGLIRNVVGHCLSMQGGGFLFFGDDLVPSSGVVWTPMSDAPSDKHHSPGHAELFFGKKSTGVKGLHILMDTGSTYTYFNSQAYQAFISSVKKDLIGTPIKGAPDDKTLAVCWKGAKPFKSIQDVKKYFKPVTLVFSKKARLEIPPEAYLIITSYGNACLGILNGSEVGLGNKNLIGDISFQDQLVIYDNEKQQIGWVHRDCNRLPNMDRDAGNLFGPYTSNMGILTEAYSAKDDL